MKIVFYSTNSNYFSFDSLKIKTFPSYKDQLELLQEKYKNIEFIIVTQLPGMFLLDIENQSIIKAKNVKYFITEKEDPKEIANLIKSFNPDIAIAFIFWITPYDWLPIKDGIISELLQKEGIKTICSTSSTGMICFDKKKCSEFLKKEKFNIANNLYVHHELYWAERNKLDVKQNIYKQYIHYKLSQLNYPVIIKDTVGLSSYGMEIATTYKQAISYLNSKKNNSDRLIEEFIFGEQFGTEVYGTNNKYFVQNPYMFSVNKYGITSPKQCIKIGPISDKKYKINKLKKILKKLAKNLKLSGIMQVDLIFYKNKWYIIEINPRISGMTATYTVSQNKSIFKLFIQIAFNKLKEIKNKTVSLNFKLPLLSDSLFNEIQKFDKIKYINQIENLNAKQIREKGYCEIVFSDCKNYKELLENLNNFVKEYPSLIEKDFLDNAYKIFDKLINSE